MTSIEPPGDGLPDNLPLLTEVADEIPDDLPVLTEVVAEEQAEPAPDQKAHGPGNKPSHALFPLPDPLGETTSHSTRLQETAAKSLVIPQAGEGANESLREFHINEEEIQRLLRRLEPHLEVVFAQRLSLRLERLQRQAVEQAVNELRDELPELLRDALKAHPGV